MYPLATVIVVAVIASVVGLLLGVLLTRSFHPQGKHNRNLETKLQKADNELKEYQQEVSNHFVETSRLINTMTQSYKDVHEHLANGALKLANPDISRQLIEASEGNLMVSHTSTDSEEEDGGNHPPRDWAPKDPGAKGQLSEDFGFENHDQELDQDKRPNGL